METISVFEVLPEEDSKTIADLIWKLLDKAGIETTKDAELQIEVYAAIFEYKQRLLKVSYNNPEYVQAYGNNYTYGYGDSLDRERVRDILLENPNLSWSN